ncbi:protein of unknown function [Streptococcus thermophilus]|nr:protein of unknown function [Streptococcus thermophilus]CAD0150188.1 protein of unknown function [Streptococcus thermophilus]
MSIYKKSHMTYNEKCSNYHFRKTHMEQLNLITNFLRIKDKISLSLMNVIWELT